MVTFGSLQGATCAGNTRPDTRQQCVNSWIEMHLAFLAGVADGCNGGNCQACLNELVNQKMQEDADARGQDCSQVMPEKLQACVNRFLVKLQAKDNSLRSKVCSVVDQICVNNYVSVLELRKLPAGSVGGCGSLGPKYSQWCVNQYALDLQRKGSASGAFTAAGSAHEGKAPGSASPQP
jgi:hypothetical protein